MVKKYILASINIYTLIITSLIYIIGLITINLYPTNINFLITLLLSILTTITIICYLNKNNKIYNIGIIMTILFNVITIYNINDLNTKYEYINNIATNEYLYNTYDVYVLKKNTTYNKIEKLDNKNIGMLKNNSNNICTLLNEEIKINCHSYNSLDEISEAIKSGEIQSFILSQNDIKALNKNEIKKEVRIIHSTKIKDTKY